MRLGLTCLDIEIAVANFFDYRRNLIVPNVYWGLGFRHELDVLVMTRGGYVTEVEIKTSRADLKADLKKAHCHISSKIRRQFFAVPADLVDTAKQILAPHWGILSVVGGFVQTERHPRINKSARPLEWSEIEHLYELAAMRTWTLKKALAARIKRANVEIAT